MSRSSSQERTIVKRAKRMAPGLIADLVPNYKLVLQEGVNEYLLNVRRLFLEALMQAEVNERTGLPYERLQERKMVRWGSEIGTAIVDSGKVEVSRPRLRLVRQFVTNSAEILLETYKAMNRTELIDGPLTRAILSGVSARTYANVVCRNLHAKGVSKSTVSRKSIAATKPTVDQFLKRKLGHIQALCLFFDGVHVSGRQAIACIAIDRSGHKHVLGVRMGATENEVVCRDLIRDLIERGLSTQDRYLFVVDGSKALIKAIHAAFGQYVAIQRCQEHKIRDVEAYLPFKLRANFRMKLKAAYGQKREETARRRLDKIRAELCLISEKATNALTEGMYETLTVHRLGVTGLLRRSLSTTNIIESAFSSVRRYMRRVTRFRDEQQRELWIVRSLAEAETHFRMVPGYRQLADLGQRLTVYKHWK